MPFCSQPEAFVGVWNSFQAGDEPAARALFDRTIMPINRIAAQGTGIFYTVHKELLRRRGILRTNNVRSPAPPVEAQTMRELTELIEQLYGV
jgi:2-keto-3-deoxy-L-arabinonate dehydratase